MRTLLIVAATLAPVVALAQDASPAPAATGNAVADAFLAIVDSAFDGVTVGSARDESGATILTDVAAGADGGASLSVATVTIENGKVASGGDPSLTADKISYDKIASADPSGAKFSVASMSLTNATLSGASSGPAVLAGKDFAGATLSTVAVENPAGARTTIAGANIALSPNGAGKSLDFTMTDLSADKSMFGDGAAQLEALGYDRFVADMKVDGAWDPASGALDVRTVAVQADQVGALQLMLGAEGITNDAMAQIQGANGDFAALLGATQAINLKNLSVSYSDAGLIGRLLDKTAADAGTDRKAIVEGTVAQIGTSLAALGSPDFTTEVTGAFRTFLEAPGTLTVSATPSAALPLAQVIGGAMMAPQSLPGLLNLKVSAGK